MELIKIKPHPLKGETICSLFSSLNDVQYEIAIKCLSNILHANKRDTVVINFVFEISRQLGVIR